ncbi:hypothetical protein BABINDRAFT_161080 [Babjeviella inositovora NRRL Y-12698]|uniref:HMG box domain-containing protein n=1 Tax=Babjeviella inositovora NRRL Y-12698 TaxID=984486 RepID=A0A1E3QR22_9ASCO|nr:uncharacterized protein BABINDRAFT_161080 [Babjeviella inositovora NRRL Y-12698]ODQ80088.1 hypothetical protein BABINDRAFT_161080 [Babjeviella inositovora NRRL Y-12698]
MSQEFKLAKDSLVASLFELSKTAQEVSAATINFYNYVSNNASPEEADEAKELLATATESLKPTRKRASKKTDSSQGNEEQTQPGSEEIEEPTKKRAKRAKAEKDPNAPKKPLTTFFVFSAEVRQKIQDERKKNGEPLYTSVELAQEVAKRWNELTDGEKEKYKNKYTTDMDLWRKEKELYDETKNAGDAVAKEASKEEAKGPKTTKATKESKAPKEVKESSEVKETEVVVPKTESKKKAKKPEAKEEEPADSESASKEKKAKKSKKSKKVTT